MKIEYIRLLGEGSFSKVYEVKINEKRFAAKLEDKMVKYPLLEKEASVHKLLYEKDRNNEYILPFYGYFEDEERRYFLMELMYMSLGDILKKVELNFDDFSIENIAKKLIDVLKFIHSIGIVHGDIKPDNVLISKDYLKIYLMDFGLAKMYMRDGRHLKIKNDVNPSGTLRYMSPYVNNNIRMSRRDDLISLGYMLIYLQKKSLPWQSIDAQTKREKYKKIASMKFAYNLDKLCEGCHKGIEKYLKYCYKLDFETAPDYNFLMNLFESSSGLKKIDE